MDLVIDIQFCKDLHKKNIPKEIAVVSLEKNFVAHWLISPPFSIKRLNKEIRQQNNWLCKNCHGIAWCDGDTSQTRVRKNLRDILKDATKIHVRGCDKVTYLQDLTADEIINLEEYQDCPAFRQLPRTETRCLYHACKSSSSSLNCALENAAKLKLWLEVENKKNEQFRDLALSLADSGSHGGSLSQRYDTGIVAETDSFCF